MIKNEQTTISIDEEFLNNIVAISNQFIHQKNNDIATLKQNYEEKISSLNSLVNDLKNDHKEVITSLENKIHFLNEQIKKFSEILINKENTNKEIIKNNTDLVNENAKQSKEIEVLKAKVASIQNANNILENSNKQFIANISAANNQIENLNKQLNESRNNNANLAKENKEINNNNIALLTSLNDTKNELVNTKNILKDTENNLSVKTNDLQVAYTNIKELNNNLTNTKVELNNTKSNLQNTYNDLENTNNILQETKNALCIANKNLYPQEFNDFRKILIFLVENQSDLAISWLGKEFQNLSIGNKLLKLISYTGSWQNVVNLWNILLRKCKDRNEKISVEEHFFLKTIVDSYRLSLNTNFEECPISLVYLEDDCNYFDNSSHRQFDGNGNKIVEQIMPGLKNISNLFADNGGCKIVVRTASE